MPPTVGRATGKATVASSDKLNHLFCLCSRMPDLIGCPPGIRTPIGCSRGSCPTIERGGNNRAWRLVLQPVGPAPKAGRAKPTSSCYEDSRVRSICRVQPSCGGQAFLSRQAILKMMRADLKLPDCAFRVSSFFILRGALQAASIRGCGSWRSSL